MDRPTKTHALHGGVSYFHVSVCVPLQNISKNIEPINFIFSFLVTHGGKNLILKNITWGKGVFVCVCVWRGVESKFWPNDKR